MCNDGHLMGYGRGLGPFAPLNPPLNRMIGIQNINYTYLIPICIQRGFKARTKRKRNKKT